MDNEAEISEEGGLALKFKLDSDHAGVLVVTISGDQFLARITIDSEPASPQLGNLVSFFTLAANAGRETQWTSLGEDLDLRAEPTNDGMVRLHIQTGSTTDDNCNWITSASLLTSPEQLNRCAEALRLIYRFKTSN